MSYVVTEACIRCRYTDCVAICPVDAFRAGKAMLVIDPDVCIDCGVCEPECPAHAIAFDTQADPKWIALNRHYAKLWPTISTTVTAPADAVQFDGMPGKFERFFTEEAGS